MNNLWNRSVGPFDEAAAQRHRHMGLLDCNGDVNADAVNFLAHLCAGLGGDPVWPSDNMIRSLSWKRPDGVGLFSTPERCGERRSRQAAPSAMTTGRGNTI